MNKNVPNPRLHDYSKMKSPAVVVTRIIPLYYKFCGADIGESKFTLPQKSLTLVNTIHITKIIHIAAYHT